MFAVLGRFVKEKPRTRNLDNLLCTLPAYNPQGAYPWLAGPFSCCFSCEKKFGARARGRMRFSPTARLMENGIYSVPSALNGINSVLHLHVPIIRAVIHNVGPTGTTVAVLLQTPRIEAGIPALVLAPMEGVTDASMRALLAEGGGFTFCVAEFLRISMAVPGTRVFRKHVPELGNGCRTQAGLPVQVQLLGGDPDKLAQAALVAVGAGAWGVDLNFGCPARTVNRHDGGATLPKYPDQIRAIGTARLPPLPGEPPSSAQPRMRCV